MKRINKRSVLTVVLALMLVLSLGFYTGLRPTTAWFNASDSVTKNYDIGTFEVDFDAYVHQSMNLTFDATTKLAEALADDEDRNAEFEYAVKYIYVTLENNVESTRTDADYLDALVKLTVGDSEGEADESLRYFYFALNSTSDNNGDGYYDEVSSDSNGTTAGGSLAAALQDFCSSLQGSTDEEIDEAFVDAMSNDDLDDDSNDALIRVPHNDSVTVCIALWVDHGDSGVTTTSFPITVSMSARQAVEG